MYEDLKSYLDSEMESEMFAEIISFLSSCHIREGKFEGNEILINKLDYETCIIYCEYELQNGKKEYTYEAKIAHIPFLLTELKNWKKKI